MSTGYRPSEGNDSVKKGLSCVLVSEPLLYQKLFENSKPKIKSIETTAHGSSRVVENVKMVPVSYRFLCCDHPLSLTRFVTCIERTPSMTPKHFHKLKSIYPPISSYLFNTTSSLSARYPSD